MNQRWLVVIVIASLALNLAVVGSFLFVRLRAPRFPPPFERPLPGMTGEQLSSLRQLRQEYRPKMDSLRGQAEAARDSLTALAAESSPRPQRVDSLLAAIGRHEMAMNRLAYEHARRIAERLPPGLRAGFFQRLREHRRGPGPRPMMCRPRRFGPPPVPEPDEDIEP